MPQPEALGPRSGANQGTAYSETAFNGASMPTPTRSLHPKLAFFISLLMGATKFFKGSRVKNEGLRLIRD